MSRLGKQPIILPPGVSAKLTTEVLTIKGPKGELQQKIQPRVQVEILNDQEIRVKVSNPEEKKERALWGLFASLIKNMIRGVTTGFSKQLEINGVGYKATLAGDQKLLLNLGFSHPLEYLIPHGITLQVEKNIITIRGLDKKLVGEVAAQIRALRKVEPYGGKGIKYVGEVVRRKAGKTAKAVGGAVAPK